MKTKLVYIKWFDSYSNTKAHEKKDLFDEAPFILETTGFYAGEEKGYVCLATEKTPYGEYAHRHYIAKVNIIKKKIVNI